MTMLMQASVNNSMFSIFKYSVYDLLNARESFDIFKVRSCKIFFSIILNFNEIQCKFKTGMFHDLRFYTSKNKRVLFSRWWIDIIIILENEKKHRVVARSLSETCRGFPTMKEKRCEFDSNSSQMYISPPHLLNILVLQNILLFITILDRKY